MPTEDELSRRASRSAMVIATVVVVLVVVTAVASREPPLSGAYGDTFGVLTALFSGVALSGLWLTIRLQKIELAATRAELRAQAEAVSRQGFENTFFAAMDLLQRVESEVRNPGSVDPAQQGRHAFFHLVHHLNGYDNGGLSKVREGDSPDSVRRIYSSWFINSAYNIGPYFDLLLQILRLIDRSRLADRQIYANLLKAAASPAQKHLIFYHGLLCESSPDFKTLLERFAFFRDFDMTQVFAIPQSRNLWYGAEATGPGVMVDGRAV
ncbi:hypothetical protein HNQ60_005112 [Povalibacter uvarum]|uniref:Phage abortive infection protein n=1 Tax=Povalibacter uvarum TaxID=732238 RepID=A0A841HVH4_9GAMM|nr:putative phage abortive infection protein [Povalibacter uvarum]MBB6096190.1 hypothetical protein [Povalibacter uvarum]